MKTVRENYQQNINVVSLTPKGIVW